MRCRTGGREDAELFKVTFSLTSILDAEAAADAEEARGCWDAFLPSKGNAQSPQQYTTSAHKFHETYHSVTFHFMKKRLQTML